MERRDVLQQALALTALGVAAPAGAQEARGRSANTLHYPLRTPEVGFDPVQINSDANSNELISQMLESPLMYDYLARPPKLLPRTATQMPEVSADGRVFTVRLKPGIFFADDPAFKGRKRELVAADYVYALMRYYDPQYNSGDLYRFDSLKLPGLSERRDQALKQKNPSTTTPLWPAHACWTATPSASNWACPTRALSSCWLSQA
jgi:ABC-type transport system substrate-binding protein